MKAAAMLFASRDTDAASIDPHLSAMRSALDRDDADQCMPVFLRLPVLRGGSEAPAGRLLRFLQLR
jgi:hypothetical protein